MIGSLWDLVVIGGGIFGSALAKAAADAGKQVCLTEQFQIGTNRGTSYGSRNLSVPWIKPGQIEATKFAIEFWRKLVHDASNGALHATSQLEVYRRGAQVNQSVSQLELHQTKYQLLETDLLRGRFPQLRFIDDAEGLQVDGYGWVGNGPSLVKAVAQAAADRGATVKEQTAVTMVRAQGDYIVIQTTHGALVSRKVVFAVGPWATMPLLKSVGIDLPLVTTQEQAIHFHNAGDRRFAPPEFPFVEDSSRGAPGVYIIPDVDGEGIKIGMKGLGPTFPFAGEPFEEAPARAEAIREYARQALPVDSSNERLLPCCYTVLAPAYQAVLARSKDPQLPNVFAITGDSGSGFKLGPALAEVTLATLDGRNAAFAGGESFILQ